MTEFVQGQRWLVDSEPELGLGMVQRVDGRAVLLYFPDSDTERQYALRDAPLTRLSLEVGDTLRYTITVANIGTENAINAMLRDQIPANTTYMAGTTTLNGVAVPDPAAPAPMMV